MDAKPFTPSHHGLPFGKGAAGVALSFIAKALGKHCVAFVG
jgi:hypothetical protein